MSTARNEYTVAIHRCGEELSPRGKEPLFEIATTADLPSLLQRYLTACAVLADEVDGRLLDDPVSAYDTAAGAIAEAIVFGHWLHVSDEMKRRAFVARADIDLDERTREVMHLVDHVPWGDVEGHVESIVEVLAPALQGTVDDLERWENSPSAADEFSLEAADVLALPPDDKIAYLARVLTTVALHVGISTAFGESAIGREAHDVQSLTGLLRALTAAVHPHDTRDMSECMEAESCIEEKALAPTIHVLYMQMRDHPDFVFGTIFIRDDFENGVVPDSFDKGLATDAMIEVGHDAISSFQVERAPAQELTADERGRRSARFAELKRGAQTDVVS
jgi:hypothetical protein